MDTPLANHWDWDGNLITDLRNGLICRSVLDPACHVLGVPIAEAGADTELFMGSRFEHRLRGRNFDVLDARVVLFRAGCSGGYPLRQDSIFERVGLKTNAAFVW